MISNDCDIISLEIADISEEPKVPPRQFKTARRRSLSGSAVTSKASHRKINFGFKIEKAKYKTNGQTRSLKSRHSTYVSTDCIHSDIENVRDNVDSNSSIPTNSPGKYHKSNSLLFTNSHRTSVSAGTKIKHFFAEHIVKIHPCHHPEYHFHKKASDTNILNEEMKSSDFHEIEFPEPNSYDSSNSSSSKEISSPKLKSSNNYTNIASTVLDRIRHMKIQSINPVHRTSVDNMSVKAQSTKDSIDLTATSNVPSNDASNYFPSPEPNPCKLPKVTSPSSIMFTSKLMASHKSTRHRLAHSVSLDPDYKMIDSCRDSIAKKPYQHGGTSYPDFSPEKDKWERKISGYLDTSTPTGAALTAINFGLKRVTETEKYVVITKSPILSPNEFLEEGINHLQDSRALYCSLLQHTNCYDLMPDSGKIIIIDSQMQIGKAFEALEDNIVRASPVWNSEKQEFITLLTVNDLIPLLLHLHQLQRGEDHCGEDENCDREDFSMVTVEKSLSVIPRYRAMQGHIAGVSPETNLYSITNMISQIRKSKVLVLDECLSGNPLFILTDLRILIYLTLKMRTTNVESCFISPIRSETLLLEYKLEILKPLSDEESPCEDLGMTTCGKTQYLVYHDSPIIDVLRAMAESYYTCALILADKAAESESQFVISDVVTISDILHLIMIKKHRDSEITASQILQYRNFPPCPMTYRDPVVSCSIDESVQHLIDLVVKEKASFALIRSNASISSPTVAVLTPIDILNYICKQSSHFSSFHNHASVISDLHKVKRPALKYSLDRLRQNSDGISPNKNSPKVLDDTLEEVFNIDVSEDFNIDLM